MCTPSTQSTGLPAKQTRSDGPGSAEMLSDTWHMPSGDGRAHGRAHGHCGFGSAVRTSSVGAGHSDADQWAEGHGIACMRMRTGTATAATLNAVARHTARPRKPGSDPMRHIR